MVVWLWAVCREQSHWHQAGRPCLLGLLFIFVTLFYLLSVCVHSHTCTNTHIHTHTLSTYTHHSIHVAVREQLSGLVLFPGSGPDSSSQACRVRGRASRPSLSRWPTVMSFEELICALLHPFNSATAAPQAPAKHVPTFLTPIQARASVVGSRRSAPSLHWRLFILLFGASTVPFTPVIAW